MQDEPHPWQDGKWLLFGEAVEEVIRQQGISQDAARKVLLDVCRSGKLVCKPNLIGSFFVFDIDLRRWLSRSKPNRGKQPKIMRHLAEMFPDRRVPDPVDYPRYVLRADLLKRDPGLGERLDEATIKSAVDKHNAQYD